MSKRGLGRGLSALIPEVDIAERDREGITKIDVVTIDANPKQPRKVFDQEKLQELAASIKEHGLVQPIVVRPKGDRYEIVAGERRWRASQIAGVKQIPALIREFSEAETMEIALIENLQREDLNPLEEAEAYKVLLEEYHLTQDELAVRLGKSRPQITNTLRLLQLDGTVREGLRDGRLSMGHAKVLLGVGDPALQGNLARRVEKEGLSVRSLEEAVVRESGRRPGTEKGRRRDDGLYGDVEQQLREIFGTPVKVSTGESKGKIEITFFGEEGLTRILDVLGLCERRQGEPRDRRFGV